PDRSPPVDPAHRAGFLSGWSTAVRKRCELGGYRQGRCRAVTKLGLSHPRPERLLRYRDRQGGAGEGPLCPLAFHARDDTTAVENGTKIMTNVSEPAALGGPSARRGGRRRLVFILLAIIAVIAVVLGGGALPGTTILGQDVAGQTPEEIAALVSDRAESVTVSVTAGDEEHEVSLADLGVTVDAAASGQAAVARDDSLGSVISSTWSGEHPVDPVVEVDEQAVSDYATSLVPEDRTDPVDAEVVFDEEEQSWTAVEARNGQGVDPTTLVDQVTEHAPALESFEVEQPVEEIAPAITTEEAEEVVDSITSLLEQPMSITSADGEVHDVSAERRSGWLSVGPDES